MTLQLPVMLNPFIAIQIGQKQWSGSLVFFYFFIKEKKLCHNYLIDEVRDYIDDTWISHQLYLYDLDEISTTHTHCWYRLCDVYALCKQKTKITIPRVIWIDTTMIFKLIENWTKKQRVMRTVLNCVLLSNLLKFFYISFENWD